MALSHSILWLVHNLYWTAVLEKTLESLLDCKEIKSVNPKGNQPWIFFGKTEAETPIFWLPDANNWLTGKKNQPWCWKRLKAEEEGDRGWDGWTVSPMQWIWTWVNSGRWWGTGKPSVLQSIGSQLGDWTTNLPWWIFWLLWSLLLGTML